MLTAEGGIEAGLFLLDANDDMTHEVACGNCKAVGGVPPQILRRQINHAVTLFVLGDV